MYYVLVIEIVSLYFIFAQKKKKMYPLFIKGTTQFSESLETNLIHLC